ncbi:MAG: STAS/SEC14 domain-containing protein [Calditrichae bacterium]|nr:STAS/SEC14 domain-containing protein [Calditrichota bacterium]MCB9057280.1 STAS/SEC14 domain-containing protein [Calditrichia bacterium]
MQQVIYHEQNNLEMAISGKVSKEDFIQVIHQWESLCQMYPKINILLDAADTKSFDFKILWDEYDFYKKYKTHLDRFALVTDGKTEKMIMSQLDKFSDADFKTFPVADVEDARKWIFRSRLP